MPAKKGLTIPYLLAWRQWRALGQEELAAKAGVTLTTISRLENGQSARMSTIGKLADALGITREELLRTQPAEMKDHPAAA